jgi:hypothetical protein
MDAHQLTIEVLMVSKVLTTEICAHTQYSAIRSAQVLTYAGKLLRPLPYGLNELLKCRYTSMYLRALCAPLPKKNHCNKESKKKYLKTNSTAHCPLLRLPPIAMLHQRQKKATCAVQALNNAAGEALLTIDEALAASLRLNERIGASRHGDAEGNFSIATIQAALQARYGRQYVLRHIKKLNERKASKWLSKQTEGRFMVMEYLRGKNSYHSAFCCEACH